MKRLATRLFPAAIIALALLVGATPRAGADPIDDAPPPTGWGAIPPAPVTPSGTGYIPIPWDTSTIDDGVYRSALNRATILPSKYDLRAAHPEYLTPARDQGGWGACWAFAASEAAGAALVRNGVLTGQEPFTDREISPLHLVQAGYFTNTFKADKIPLSPSNAYNQGGNDLMTAAAWSHWYGAQTETAYPYPLDMSYTAELPPVLSPAALQSSAYHMTSMFMLPTPYDSHGTYSAANVAAIKQAVFTYGSVTTAYAGSLMNTSYYKENGADSSFYVPIKVTSDHEVLIIGWDDAFETRNFTNTPPGPGAFLIQNSWGVGNDDYFWLSYYDRSMYTSAVYDMVSAAPTANHQSPYEWTKQYSYDSLGAYGALTYYTNTITYANKFTASANSMLRATQIVTRDPNMKYKVAVYVGAIKSNSPTSGGAAQVLTASGAKSVSGALTYAGYNTLAFERPVTLKKGQQFSVVLTLTAPAGADALIALEANVMSPTGMSKVSISSGQSYAKTGSTWYDFTTIFKSGGMTGAYGNANIIALTSPAPKYQLNYNANGGTVAAPSKVITFNSKLGTLATPKRAGYSFTGWYTAASGGSKYTSTKVMTFLADKTVYAHWKAKTYTAKFSANGGSTPTKSGKKYTAKTVTFNKTYGALPTTKRTGYTFAGWFTGKTAGTQVTSSTPVDTTGTRTLYAHWLAVG